MTVQPPAVPNVTATAATQNQQSVYLWWISAVAALGGLLFGYDWVVIGGARQFFEIYFHLTSPALVGWANSCALLGCLIGSLAAGTLADRWGRRPVLLASAILFAVSSALTGWAFSFSAFLVWRIAGGTAIGLSSNLSPLYIAEVSPAAIRGRLVSLNQFAIVVGILLGQIINWRIARPVEPNLSASAMLASWNVQFAWRWMFCAIVIPSLVFAVASLFLPESPRWLIARGQVQAANKILERVGGSSYAARETAAIERTLAPETATRASWRDLFRPGLRRVLFLGVALAVLQQWTGINILFNYAGVVYRSAGYGENAIFFDIVITGAINLVFTIVSMAFVDRLGRRPMMIFGCMGIAISHLLCAFAYHAGWRGSAVLVLTLSAIACYSMTLAPVTWVLISEIFPNRIRSHGISATVSALWIACFLLTYTFPILDRLVGTGGVFVLYGTICLLGWVFTLRYVPETKGRTLEQLESGLASV